MNVRQLVRSLGPLLLAGSLGCSSALNRDVSELFGGKASDKDSAGQSPLKVSVDGANIALSAGQVASTKTKDFAPRLQTMLAEKRKASAREFVQRQPDVAIETLRQALGERQVDSTVQFVAETYDRQLAVPPQQGWSKAFGAAAKETAAYGQARGKLFDAIGQGKVPEGAINDVLRTAEATGAGVLRIDAFRSAALARLVLSQPAKATATLRDAGQLASQFDPYQELSILLLLSDSLRREGKHAEANEAWTVAVERGARLAANRPATFDPVFWDNASYLRPVQVSWPTSVVASLRAIAAFPAGQEPADSLRDTERNAVVWAAIGQGLLDRGDSDAALVAFKRAETSADAESTRGWTRVAQANALARINQASAATAVVAGLVSHPDPAVGAAATVTLGTIKLAAADTDAGFRLLKQGLAADRLEGWGGLADAEADFGLAVLLRGDEAEGLRWLHSAQGRYESQQDASRLARCLTNEAEYQRFKKHRTEEATLVERIKSIEQL